MSIEHTLLLLFCSRNISDSSTSIFAHLSLGKPKIPELIAGIEMLLKPFSEAIIKGGSSKDAGSLGESSTKGSPSSNIGNAGDNNLFSGSSEVDSSKKKSGGGGDDDTLPSFGSGHSSKGSSSSSDEDVDSSESRDSSDN
jgi:hypothetical protein